MESINGRIINGVMYEAVEVDFNGCDDCDLNSSSFCELSNSCLADLTIDFSILSAMFKKSLKKDTIRWKKSK